NPTLAHSVLARVRSHEPASVPITMPSIINQSLFITTRKFGPVNSCQKLVTKDGITSSEAALTGDMIAPRIPTATVGNPIPDTPLTIPARKNVDAIIRTSGER